MKPGPATRESIARLGALAAFPLLLLAYQAVGQRFYDGFRIPQGQGMTHLLPPELGHLVMFVVFGVPAWAALACAIRGPATRSAAALLDSMAQWGARFAWLVAATVACAASLVGWWLLGRHVTTDDEHVYRFIAQTLRAGALVAPSPGADLGFYREQFVVLTETVRFGKYPIGHPLLLALGQAVGLEGWVVPVVTGLVALPLFRCADLVAGRRVAALSVLLYGLSPQVIFTGATYLSQPAAALVSVSALACILSAERSARPLAWLAGAGALLGAGLHVRLLPGGLFVAATGAYLAWSAWRRHANTSWRGLAAFAAPVAVALTLLMLVNRAQTGGFLTIGYQAFHGTGAGAAGMAALTFGEDLAATAMSIVSSLLRLDVWLFGWPLSLLPLCAAARNRERLLIWMLIAAAFAYRVVAPKAGVGGTGPIYLFEVVPLLCLLSADGLVRLAGRVRDGRNWVPAGAAAGLVVALTFFLPVKAADLSRMRFAQSAAPGLVASKGLHRALVFHQGIVPFWSGLSWAYYPRCNAPALDDDVLYLNLDGDPYGVAGAVEFWSRRYPDREAWVFEWQPGQAPALIPLAVYVTRGVTTQPAGTGPVPAPAPVG